MAEASLSGSRSGGLRRTGASRAVDGRRLRLEEIHRFENGAIAAAGGLYWDVLGLWSHIVTACAAGAISVAGSKVSASIPGAWILRCWDAATCCWRIPTRIATRGPRNVGAGIAHVPREEIFAKTGAQFLANQHALSIARPERAKFAPAGNGGIVLDDARLVSLAADGREGQRIHRRQRRRSSTIPRRAAGRRGFWDNSACRRISWAKSSTPARTWASSRAGRRRDGAGERLGRTARHARYGQRGHGRASARRAERAARLVLHQLGHVVT